MDTFHRVGVVGTGTIGSGITQTCAQAGYPIIMVGRSEESLRQAMAAIEKGLGRLVERGRLSEEAKRDALGHIATTMGLSAVKECALVIEAVSNPAVKEELFRRLDARCPPETILASDTSTLPIVELAKATGRPDRVGGLHFLSPALSSAVRLVEQGMATKEDINACMNGMQPPSGSPHPAGSGGAGRVL